MNVNQSRFCSVRGRGNRNLNRPGKIRPSKNFINQNPRTPSNNRASSSTSNGKCYTPNLNFRRRAGWLNINSGSQSHSSSNVTPQSSSSTLTESDNSHMIIAVCEGRGNAREEIGIAALDLRRPELGLYQVSDTQGFIKSFTAIQMLDPVEILVPLTLSDTRLAHMLKSRFRTVTINSIPRRWYDAHTGLQQLQHLCAPVYANCLLDIQHKYYALAAASALVRQLENVKQIAFSPKSVKVVHLRTDHIMAIDCDTAYRLELIASTKGSNRHSSLLGILNHCLTRGGYRLLRANILQPLCMEEMIKERLLSVEELIHSPDLLAHIKMILPKFYDVDSILTLCMKTPQRERHRAAEIQLNYILILKTILCAVPALIESLNNAQSTFFVRIKQNLITLKYQKIMDCISRIIHKDAHPCKGHLGDLQRCFTVQSGINELLDFTRTIYSELLQKIRDLVEDYAQKYNIPLVLNNTSSKGFHIVMRTRPRQRSLKAADLPPEFINITQHPSSFTMTTMKLVELNRRLKNSQREVEVLSNTIICNLLNEIRDDISTLYTLCESVSELDLVQSLGEAGSVLNYVKPEFTSFLDLENSRHPMLEYLSEKEPVPNDIFATEDHNFHIVTGPNMSGKSIYIRQLALIQIMAQIGSFVPATRACLRISNRIFARINFDDCIESDASTFQLDIREMKIILDLLTPTSLVIIDELCRGTIHDEGTAIAWALCEEFLNTKAFVFFTTHFITITKLEEMYLNVTNWHMEAIEVQIKNEVRLRFTYRLLYGITTVGKYGLAAARASAMPRFVVKRASELIDQLRPTVQPVTDTIDQPEFINRLAYNLIAKIKFLYLKNQLDVDMFRNLIHQFRQAVAIDEDDSNKSSYRHLFEKFETLPSNNLTINNAFEQNEDSSSKSKISSDTQHLPNDNNEDIFDEVDSSVRNYSEKSSSTSTSCPNLKDYDNCANIHVQEIYFQPETEVNNLENTETSGINLPRDVKTVGPNMNCNKSVSLFSNSDKKYSSCTDNSSQYSIEISSDHSQTLSNYNEPTDLGQQSQNYETLIQGRLPLETCNPINLSQNSNISRNTSNLDDYVFPVPKPFKQDKFSALFTAAMRWNEQTTQVTNSNSTNNTLQDNGSSSGDINTEILNEENGEEVQTSSSQDTIRNEPSNDNIPSSVYCLVSKEINNAYEIDSSYVRQDTSISNNSVTPFMEYNYPNTAPMLQCSISPTLSEENRGNKTEGLHNPIKDQCIVGPSSSSSLRSLPKNILSSKSTTIQESSISIINKSDEDSRTPNKLVISSHAVISTFKEANSKISKHTRKGIHPFEDIFNSRRTNYPNNFANLFADENNEEYKNYISTIKNFKPAYQKSSFKYVFRSDYDSSNTS